MLCRYLCEALGVTSFTSRQYEADDVVGTLATRMRAAGQNVTLVTRDKDLAQLIRPGDEYWDYIGEMRFRYDQIAERFGVQPERMACFLALTGDAVDNIPGVPGVGRKTASMLFHHFESLAHLYDDLDRVLKLKQLRNPGFVCGQLRDHRESAFLARQLTRDRVRRADRCRPRPARAPAARPRRAQRLLRHGRFRTPAAQPGRAHRPHAPEVARP